MIMVSLIGDWNCSSTRKWLSKLEDCIEWGKGCQVSYPTPMEISYYIEVQLMSLSFCSAVAVIPLNNCELWHGIFHEDLKCYRRVSDA